MQNLRSFFLRHDLAHAPKPTLAAGFSFTFRDLASIWLLQRSLPHRRCAGNADDRHPTAQYLST
jgi:hypothetical protein